MTYKCKKSVKTVNSMCHNYEGMNDLSELQLTCVNFFR